MLYKALKHDIGADKELCHYDVSTFIKKNKLFFRNYESAFHPCSPFLDRHLYDQHVEKHSVNGMPILLTLHKHIDEAIACSGLLLAVTKSYGSFVDESAYEYAFNQLYIWTYLGCHCKSVTVYGYECCFAFVEEFSHVKAFFLHDAGTISFCQLLIHDAYLERTFPTRINVQPWPKLIKICWTTKRLLEEAAINIVQLREEHRTRLSKDRYSSEPPSSPYDIVHQIILKLTMENNNNNRIGSLGIKIIFCIFISSLLSFYIRIGCS
ncbi:hypothetical protein AB4K20DRAFT_1867475 [Rhizopus microsporus]|uniref:Uncharacterized protein n=1 Tax=Rhizopus microsporus TaxID=58291 RepID=A0A1X0RUX7_RHIZD|nr:hypothetical protein BCV71DRAFT_237208 [Rhizopus microsporus]